MNFWVEECYTIVESAIMIGFLSISFQFKARFRRWFAAGLSFLLFLGLDTAVSVTNAPLWIAVPLAGALLLGILQIFYAGELGEHLFIVIVSLLLLALIDLCVLTLLSAVLGQEYSELVTNSTALRFLAVMTAKLVYLIVIGIIVFVKKKYTLLFHKPEYFLLSLALAISVALILLVRNMIYHTELYYRIFLITLLCVLSLNVILYCTMIYISKKNITEKNMALMEKQLEMQEESIRLLEENYDKTAKIRHDIKNHLLCALRLVKDGDVENAIHYLEELTDEKLNSISGYIKTNRKVVGAVLNAKIGKAEQLGFQMHCCLASEMETVSDIEVGILLANLLDNALEACEKNMGASEIHLKSWEESGYYCLKLSNTAEFPILLQNPQLKTDKKDPSLHGIGLRSVREIIEKYNGAVNFEQRNNKFFVCITIEKGFS